MRTLTKSYVVTDDMTASKFASGTLDVFGTPALIGCMEDTAKTMMDEDLKEGDSSVGTKVGTTHIKATKVGATITVRKMFQGVGVERVFPIYSPRLEKITVLRRGDVKRAKLYYLRERAGKSARIKEKIEK